MVGSDNRERGYRSRVRKHGDEDKQLAACTSVHARPCVAGTTRCPVTTMASTPRRQHLVKHPADTLAPAVSINEAFTPQIRRCDLGLVCKQYVRGIQNPTHYGLRSALQGGHHTFPANIIPRTISPSRYPANTNMSLARPYTTRRKQSWSPPLHPDESRVLLTPSTSRYLGRSHTTREEQRSRHGQLQRSSIEDN